MPIPTTPGGGSRSSTLKFFQPPITNVPPPIVVEDDSNDWWGATQSFVAGIILAATLGPVAARAGIIQTWQDEVSAPTAQTIEESDNVQLFLATPSKPLKTFFIQSKGSDVPSFVVEEDSRPSWALPTVPPRQIDPWTFGTEDIPSASVLTLDEDSILPVFIPKVTVQQPVLLDSGDFVTPAVIGFVDEDPYFPPLAIPKPSRLVLLQGGTKDTLTSVPEEEPRVTWLPIPPIVNQLTPVWDSGDLHFVTVSGVPDEETVFFPQPPEPLVTGLLFLDDGSFVSTNIEEEPCVTWLTISKTAAQIPPVLDAGDVFPTAAAPIRDEEVWVNWLTRPASTVQPQLLLDAGDLFSAATPSTQDDEPWIHWLTPIYAAKSQILPYAFWQEELPVHVPATTGFVMWLSDDFG